MTGLHGQVAMTHAQGKGLEAVQILNQFMEGTVAQEKSKKKRNVMVLIVLFLRNTGTIINALYLRSSL